MPVYTSKDLQQRSGATHMQISRWTELGIILPEEDAKGRGRVRRFNQQNLIEAMICKQLTEYFRLDTSIMLEIVSWLRDNAFFPPGRADRQTYYEYTMAIAPEEPIFLTVFPGGDKLNGILGPAKELRAFLKKHRVSITINVTRIIEDAGGL